MIAAMDCSSKLPIAYEKLWRMIHLKIICLCLALSLPLNEPMDNLSSSLWKQGTRPRSCCITTLHQFTKEERDMIIFTFFRNVTSVGLTFSREPPYRTQPTPICAATLTRLMH